ncbi:MAG: NirD/YgiW/YdeI family stress tolerance protein [Spirochaetia bacterium]
MKKTRILVFLILSIPFFLFAQNAKEVKINYIKTKAQHYENVIVQGQISRQIDDDEYILSDESGSIKIELEEQAEYSVMGQSLKGATVRIFAMVDKDDWYDPAELKVFKIRVISGSATIPDDF